MAYVKQNWENLPSTNTPITAERLNHMEDGIAEAWEHGGGSGAGETLRIGTILPYTGSDSELPTGYMLCDGAELSRTDYSDLFAVIGTSFGAGNGSSTFNLPNLKGKVLTGLDSNDTDFASMGTTGGSKFIQDHTHNSMYSVETTGVKGNSYGSIPFVRAGGTTTDSVLMRTSNITSLTTGDAGNLQPYVVVNYIIKVTQSAPVQAQIVGTYTESAIDGYSCNYINDISTNEYSTNEIKTNKVWVDGRPIYRKVITGTTTTVDASFRVSHGISNYDFIMIDNKSFIKSVGTSTICVPINCPPNVSSDYNKRPTKATIVDNDISIYIGSYNGYTSYDYAIILEYTKTTD